MLKRERRLLAPPDIPLDLDVPHQLNPPTIFPPPELAGEARSQEPAPGIATRWTSLLALVPTQVAAALWHHFVRRDTVLRAMLPKGSSRRP